MITNITNNGDIICNLCIQIMEQMSEMTGYSYGLINVLLFLY